MISRCDGARDVWIILEVVYSQLSVPLILIILHGCARQQNYEILPSTDAASVDSSQNVLDVTTVHTSRTEHVNFPLSEKVETLAVLTVDQVLRGGEQHKSLNLRNYRNLTPEERALFPYGWGIMQGVRLRIGYKDRFGDRFVNLKIMPIGLTPEVQDAVRAHRTQSATQEK